MPLANGFLTEEQFADEYFFELKVGTCETCGMVQLAESVDRDRMFITLMSCGHNGANRYSGFSEGMRWMRSSITRSPYTCSRPASNAGLAKEA